MKIPFYKYQGAGNDFVIIDQRVVSYLNSQDQEIIAKICDRRFGVGADGLMFIQNTENAEFEMVYFNADGKASSMCGNGGRCIVSLAKKVGAIKSQSCSFLAVDGLHSANILMEDLVSLKMRDVDCINKDGNALIVNTGSPHYVRIEDDINNINVIEEARRIRFNDRYKDGGINVNFVENKKNILHIRTYERGVEDETLACGTGVTAAAIVAAHLNGSAVEYSYEVMARGGKLSVSFEREGQGFKNIWLTGPAVFVFEGLFSLK